MRWDLLLASCFLMGGIVAARGDIVSAPDFSADEIRTIARNELLRDVVQDDPWLVRRLLDLIVRQAPDAGDIDPGSDPDLAASPRDTLGLVEWNALVKRAKLEKEARRKALAPVMQRSSEGSVELIDMMRKAKSRKDAGDTN